jgi:hypothetical protein
MSKMPPAPYDSSHGQKVNTRAEGVQGLVVEISDSGNKGTRTNASGLVDHIEPAVFGKP